MDALRIRAAFYVGSAVSPRELTRGFYLGVSAARGAGSAAPAASRGAGGELALTLQTFTVLRFGRLAFSSHLGGRPRLQGELPAGLQPLLPDLCESGPLVAQLG